MKRSAYFVGKRKQTLINIHNLQALRMEAKMFMNKDDADALAEQQAREIRNLKFMKYNERERIVRLIRSHPIGNFVRFKCTSCDDFPDFINNWINDLCSKITNNKSEINKCQ